MSILLSHVDSLCGVDLCVCIFRQNQYICYETIDTQPVHHIVCMFTTQHSLVLIVQNHRGMSRLSLPGWLVKYGDGLPAHRHLLVQ